ncbi:S-adenosyl-L-methionine-dependent methyltransferases superfamily protein [Perilla frutescens var. hirtella]|nr:S-adenosyl-L-methionine-dependent methyltransferases superfamily protein [Perilla frutescens var. hirtella]
MAALSVPSILKERKYPFVFAFFLLLIFVTFLLISNSQSPPIPISTNLAGQTDSFSATTPSSAASPDITTASLPANDSSSSTADTDANATNNDATGSPPPAAVENSVVDVAVDWELCKGEAVDFIPCLDNWKAIKALPSRRNKEHRERHCPDPAPRCLVPLPEGYRVPVPWPKSRDMIWYNNVPHPKLVDYKKDQRWVVKSGNYFVFPGGGTQFKKGVQYYIGSIEKMFPAIEFGKKTRVVLDVGCGVASFGGALLDRDVMTMSLAPKDEHEAQIQFALERGIPATLSVIGTQKLTFPDSSYDVVHCARCRVHWDGDGGKPLLELNRILRPGGYFIWSATPVYKKDDRHQAIWKSMVALTKSICWSEVAKMPASAAADVGIVIYQKSTTSSCYKNRKESKPPLCDQQSRPNNSWYTPLDSCLVPLSGESYKWPSPWPQRLSDKPQSLSKPDAAVSYREDTTHWSALVSEVYLGGLDINWSNVRNVMDMNAGNGGFAAALISQPIWVMNVVPIHESDTLSVIYDRGLIGVYHDWCESFNTYPRTYDLLHSSFLLAKLIQRCDIVEVAAEMDRILRPGGYLLVQDTVEMLNKITPILKSLHWSVNVHQDQFLVGKKEFWRPGYPTRRRTLVDSTVFLQFIYEEDLSAEASTSMPMAYQSRARKRVHANPIRRASDGSAFQNCESCGISVAIALADMHECGFKKNTRKKFKTPCTDVNVDMHQPRSAFRFFMEEFLKTCTHGNLIEKDKKGCETWKNMSRKEKQPYVDQADKLDAAYAKLLREEENKFQWVTALKNFTQVDDEADSAQVGKHDENYEDSEMDYYDSESPCGSDLFQSETYETSVPELEFALGGHLVPVKLSMVKPLSP